VQLLKNFPAFYGNLIKPRDEFIFTVLVNSDMATVLITVKTLVCIAWDNELIYFLNSVLTNLYSHLIFVPIALTVQCNA
jgi:hypothetical protein